MAFQGVWCLRTEPLVRFYYIMQIPNALQQGFKLLQVFEKNRIITISILKSVNNVN